MFCSLLRVSRVFPSRDICVHAELLCLYVLISMPRKFKLGRHYKNEERKKRAERRQAEVTEEASVAETLVVSLPLSVFIEAPLCDPKALGSRLEASHSVPLGKLYLLTNVSSCRITILINPRLQDGM